MRRLLFSFLLLFFSALAFSEYFRIDEVVYNLQGKTTEYALSEKITIEKDRIFSSVLELEKYCEGIKQQLENLRFAKELSVEIDYGDFTGGVVDIFGQRVETDNLVTVKMLINATDSRHFLILPYPKYDNNAGFSGKIKIKDTNFLGSLNEMNAEIFVESEKREEGRSTETKKPSLGANFSYSHPFPLGPFHAKWHNACSFNYNFEKDEPYPAEYMANTGLFLNLPINKKFSFEQDYSIKGALDNYYATNSIDNGFGFGDAIYFNAAIEYGFPFRLNARGNIKAFEYRPYIKYDHSFDKDGISSLNEDLVSPYLGLGQRLTLGQINWVENFRSGVEFSTGQSIGFNFKKVSGEQWIAKIDFEAKAFKAFKYIGLAMDLRVFFSLNEREFVGNRVRGVMDKQFYASINDYSLKTDRAIVLNLDLPIKLFRTNWKKVSKKSKSDWIQNLDFEMQLSPFIDIALTNNEQTGRTFALKDGFYTAGFEILVYPLRWKNIVIRGSLGFDLTDSLFRKITDQDFRNSISHHEVYIGFGLHY